MAAVSVINGERVSGNEIRSQNVQAAVSVSNIVRTSLGPVGLDKMMVDEVGVRFWPRRHRIAVGIFGCPQSFRLACGSPYCCPFPVVCLRIG